MANTFVLINKVNVGSGGQSSISFTSVPQTYTDLMLLFSVRGSYANTRIATYVTFNGSGVNYTDKRYYGQDVTSGSMGSSTNDGSNNSIGGLRAPAANSTANYFGNSELYISNYTSTSIPKSVLFSTVAENNATSDWNLSKGLGLWNDTSAITTVTIGTAGLGGFDQYSNAYLFGIKNS